MYTPINKPSEFLFFEHKADYENIAKFLSRLDQSIWTENVSRQLAFSEHKETLSIFVLWTGFQHNYFNPRLQTKHPALYHPFEFMLKDTLEFLRNFYNGVIFKILIVKLKAFSVIPPHPDSGFSLELTHRIHIPIITNENVSFTVGNSTIIMMPGQLYEINNLTDHSVCNNSNQDRIHLIIDIIENKTIEEGQKLKEHL